MNATTAQIAVGTTVTLTNTTPKYLTGVTGVVESIGRTRADVRISAQMASDIGWGADRYYMWAGTKDSQVLTGIPLACLIA